MKGVDLKKWRKKWNDSEGLTQKEAADKLFTSLSQYQRWESGVYDIPPLVEAYIKLLAIAPAPKPAKAPPIARQPL